MVLKIEKQVFKHQFAGWARRVVEKKYTRGDFSIDQLCTSSWILGQNSWDRATNLGARIQ
jgi:hypothetical protein